MTSVVAFDAARALFARGSVTSSSIDIALLGCGNVGSAFAALAQREPPDRQVRITHVLVRDCHRPRPTLQADAARIDDVTTVFATPPDVLVELLGGIEPARSLVVEALHRGIPVVTANKSLLAAHGAELREVAARTATPLLYEAAVIAGVPFLGTFGRRPHAANVTSLVGIANGTSNYILTRARDSRCGIDIPLTAAQRLGYAEPDPSKDIDGIDAAEKLIVLLQHFATVDIHAASLETTGIRSIDAADIDHAGELGGTIKPVIWADWSGRLQAFTGPAFLPSRHVLASVDGVENAIVLGGSRGRLVFRGPGAGPDVTAATVMDDVFEAATTSRPIALPALNPGEPVAPETGWFLALTAAQLPGGIEVADLLASHGIYLRRTSETTAGRPSFAALTWPAPRPRVESAVRALAAAAGCETKLFRALEG